MEVREPMDQPGDGIGFAAAGRVLDQIIGSDTADARVGHQLSDAIELVVTGKYHGLLLGMNLARISRKPSTLYFR